MKATLEFNLDDFDDRMAHLRATKATDLALCLWQISNNLKKEIEHEMEQSIPGDEFEILDMIFEKIASELESHHIALEELIN